MIFTLNTTLQDWRDFVAPAFSEHYLISLITNPLRLQITYKTKNVIVELGEEVQWNGSDFIIVQKNYYKSPMGEAFQLYTMPIKAWPEWAERMWDGLPFDNYSICMHNKKYFVRFESRHAEIGTTDWLVKTANGEIKLMSNNRFNEWRNR